jgi:hypothetical protein
MEYTQLGTAVDDKAELQCTVHQNVEVMVLQVANTMISRIYRVKSGNKLSAGQSSPDSILLLRYRHYICSQDVRLTSSKYELLNHWH